MILEPMFLIFVLAPTIIMGMITQGMVKRAYSKYSRVGTRRGMTGARVARQILDSNGLRDVPVDVTPGHLSDHYDPRSKTLRLSPDVYNGNSVASVGIAAHEAGHALQHADAYVPLTFRNQLFPVANLGSQMAIPMAVIGFFILQIPFIGNLGIILYAAAVVFSIVTLPVEFNASSRAMRLLQENGVVQGAEVTGVRKVLGAAAMTYVAATLSAVLTLVYLLMMRRD